MTLKGFNWRRPLYIVLASAMVRWHQGSFFGPRMVLGNEIGTFLLSLGTAFIVCLILLVVAIRTIRPQTVSALLMISLFCAGCWPSLRCYLAVQITRLQDRGFGPAGLAPRSGWQ